MALPPADLLSQTADAGRAGQTPPADLEVTPWFAYRELLRRVSLRPTRQRMALAWILFSRGNRHVTAEMLHDEAIKAKVPVSLATIYNNLHQFTETGLVQQVAVDGSKAFFDTNTAAHHHFFLSGEHDLVDIPGDEVVLGKMPEPPPGYEITRVDVVIRLRRKPRRHGL
ncbi:MAG: transcriptional repressor [Bradyrhizobiaceae bacterium]|nr:transcriptional repressor [Bradyrhizobiaceae bacterium]